MKNMMINYETPIVEPIKVVTGASVVACVYCGGAYLFEKC